MSGLARRFVAFFDTTEKPTTMALIRVLMPLILLTDLGHVWMLGLHDVMWFPSEDGGWSVTANHVDDQPLWASIFGPESGTMLFWVTVLLCLTTSTGTFSRTSALLLVLCYAQLEDFLPVSDRAIDRLYRNLLLVLACSGAGKAWSVDAWLAGNLRGVGVTIGGWARRLFILQIVWMYFDAGIEKTAHSWGLMGHYDALWIILQDPVMTRVDFTGLGAWFLWVTRIGTAGTVWWEMLFPLMLVALFAETGRLGPLGERLRRVHFREVFLAIGVFFHLCLWATLELGIFPPAMLVLYPCFFAPEEVERAAHWFSGRSKANTAPASG
ncbi:MAG: hypothetical protein EP330_07585 [Deltaproteobacteria bacterium]|nr:MAG: hypothetical protein EP330_07585 [Deltaproteobacteria bacterium]